LNSLLYSDGSSLFVKKGIFRHEEVLKVSFRVPKISYSDVSSFLPTGFENKKINIEKAWVCFCPDGERRHVKMRKISKGRFWFWEGRLPLNWKRIGYRFEVLTDEGLLYLDQQGTHKSPPFDINEFVYIENTSPSWLAGTTFYQIFPDRFCRSKKDRCAKKVVLRKWGSKLRTFRQSGSMDFYGGDLPGIEEKVDYLVDLGIKAVYLNPIFHSPSNHRYDTQDYRNVDPKLGTNDDFAQLVKTLHSKGIKVILDAVFNHVGTSHKWFNREELYKEKGAWQDLNSPNAEFFKFYKHPHQYDCWLGVDTLPLLDFRSQKLRDELYRDENSIGAQWLKPPYNIDGYRFDVANMMARNGPVQLHKEVWEELSLSLKKIKADSYLMGEHFFDPVDLLDGSGLDGVMNYHGFTHPLLRWLTEIEPLPPKGCKEEIKVDYPAGNFATDIHQAASRLPFSVQSSQYNLLGSHDTARALTRFSEDEDRLKLAMMLLFTWPGVPAVYYGDEIGFSGGNDPFCRECMEWDSSTWNDSLLNFYKILIYLKAKEGALKFGGYRILSALGDLFVFARIYGDEMILVLINRGFTSTTSVLELSFTGVKEGSLLLLAKTTDIHNEGLLAEIKKPTDNKVTGNNRSVKITDEIISSFRTSIVVDNETALIYKLIR